VKLSEGIESISGEAAREGTAAHELAGNVLERSISRSKPWLDELNDTVKAVSIYLEYVSKLTKGKVLGEDAFIEQRLDMSDLSAELFGTADCAVICGDTLHVVDYKHGAGIVVEAKDNMQLEYYALGVLHKLKRPFAKVQMTIVQPRAYHPDGPIRHWVVPSVHFIDAEAQIVAEAEATRQKKAPLIAGTHCTFCVAKKICSEFDGSQVKKAQAEFRHYKDPALEFEAVVK